VINLGTLPNVGTGYVSGMSADGSIVVGWFDGPFFGDPQTPFIWTRNGGLQDLNAFINNLGYSTSTYQAFSAESISPDGNYIAGYGVNNTTFTYFVFRLSLNSATGIQQISKNENLKVYPNPTSSLLTIENSTKANLTITSVDGKIVFKSEINGTQVLNLSNFESGIYTISLKTGDDVKYQKIIKN
jgi:hypothetical protein